MYDKKFIKIKDIMSETAREKYITFHIGKSQ